MIARLLVLLLLLLLLPAPAVAQPSDSRSLEGSWALRLDGAIIFRFDLVEDGEGWSGTWSRPTSFASDGNRFGNLTGPTETVEASETREIGGWVELTFPDNRPGAVPDIFRFRLMDPDSVEMIYVDTGLAPYTLERVAPDALLGPWERGKVYAREGAAGAGPAPRSSPEPREEVQGPPGEPAFEGR